MRPMIVRQLTLAQSMVDAWKDVGGWFPKRERPTLSKLDLMRDRYDPHSPIINLGDMSFSPSDGDLLVRGLKPDLFFNRPSVVRGLTTPGGTRRLIDEFLPLDPRNFPPADWENPCDVWVKAPGQTGQGKTKLSQVWGTDLPTIPADWDMQFHVEGQEYRVVTVGTKVVQVNERYGENGDRSYVWVGVHGSPNSVKEIAREAARRLGDERTIIGWDVILEHEGSTYILEGNTCPGTNSALAGRIMNQIEGVPYAG